MRARRRALTHPQAGSVTANPTQLRPTVHSLGAAISRPIRNAGARLRQHSQVDNRRPETLKWRRRGCGVYSPAQYAFRKRDDTLVAVLTNRRDPEEVIVNHDVL